jgi:hypothetical protein
VKRHLLLDSEVVTFLKGLSPARRAAIWRRLGEIAETPERFEDFHERDDVAGNSRALSLAATRFFIGTILLTATSRCWK